MTRVPRTRACTLPRWTVLALLVALVGLVAVALAPSGAAEPVVNASEGDARGRLAAASLTGDASCSGFYPVSVTLFFRDHGLPPCVAVSGNGSSSGDVALAAFGNASCDWLLCPAVSGTGSADGREAVSGSGDASGSLAAVSGGGDASAPHGVAVTGDGGAYGEEAAVAGAGDATAEDYAVSGLGDARGRRLAVSGTGDTRSDFGIAASVLGNATGDDLALSLGAGAGSRHDAIAISGLGRHAVGHDVAVAGAGDARSPGGLAASVLGNASGGDLALAGAGDASSRDGLAASVLGNASGHRVGASGTGDAEASHGPAVSLTGDADGRFLAVSGTGNATQECRAHPPIVIAGDVGPTGFAVENPVTGEPVHRPGSGVVAGSGTEDDPYVISGWCIWDAETGIRIAGTSAHVVVTGNDLRNHRTGVEVVAAENVTVRNNTILPSPADGDAVGPAVHLVRTHGARVDGNRIADHETGVLEDATDGTRVVDNRILRSSGPGIEATGGSDAVVRGNTLRFGDASGVLLHGTRDARVEGNVAFYNDDHGILLNATNGTEVVDNRAEWNDDNGVSVLDATDVEVRRNRLSNNYAGIGTFETWPLWLAPSEDLLIAGNTVTDNDLGVGTTADEDVRIRDNTVDGNDWYGALVYRADGTLVAGNELEGQGRGALVWEANDTTVARNHIERNTYGVDSMGATNLSVTGNEMPRNGRAGVYLQEGSSQVEVSDNEIARTGRGIVLRASVDVLVDGNDVTRTGDVGVRVRATAAEPHLVDNTLSRNPDDVHLSGAQGVVLDGNTMGSGLVVDGNQDHHFRHEVPPTNTVDGEPLRYVRDAQGRTVSGPAGQVVVALSEDVTVEGVAVDDARRAVHVAHSVDTTVRNATLEPRQVGVLASSSNGTRVASSAVGNATFGIYAEESPGTAVGGSAFSNLTHAVVAVDGSRALQIHDNAFVDVGNATIVQAADEAAVRDNDISDVRNGVLLLYGENATVAGNDGDGKRIGVGVAGGSGHRVAGNALSFDLVDAYLQRTRNATFWGNALHRAGLYVFAEDAADWRHEVAANNTVHGDPLRYVRQDGETVSASAGQVVVAEAEDVTVDGVDIAGPLVGIQTRGADNLTVRDAAIRNASRAVEAHATDDLTVRGSRLGNATWGVLAYPFAGAPVSDDVVLRDTVLENVTFGLVNNGDRPRVLGTTFDGSDFAVHLPGVPDPHLEDTTVLETRVGLSLPKAQGGTLAGNDLDSSLLDVNLKGASGFEVTGNAMATGVFIRSYEPGGVGDHDIDATNTVAGGPLRYVEDAQDVHVPAGAGQVFVAGSSNVTVGPHTRPGFIVGVGVHDSEDVLLRSPNLTGGRLGLLVWDSDDVRVDGGNLSRNNRGLRSHISSQLQVNGTRIAGNADGAVVRTVDRTTFSNNTVVDNDGWGLLLDDGEQDSHVRALDNRVERNGAGIVIPGTTSADVHGNNVEGNDLGMRAWAEPGEPTIDARRNWWGCPDGPDASACDDVRGLTGEPDEVLLDPWLTSPNPDAGAG